MKILTWNIWFDLYHIDERVTWILDEIKKYNPDIVCLQEVNFESSSMINNENSILNLLYKKVQTNVENIEQYWESTYIKFKQPYLEKRYPYKYTNMGRGLTTVSIPALNLIIGNTHLESLNNKDIRISQVKEALIHLKSYQMNNIILLGDMNLIDGQNIDKNFPKGWADAWEKLHPNKVGYTYDYKINNMLNKNIIHRERLDRIFFKTPDYNLKSIELIGTNSKVIDNGNILFPSDHFGLLLTIEQKS